MSHPRDRSPFAGFAWALVASASIAAVAGMAAAQEAQRVDASTAFVDTPLDAPQRLAAVQRRPNANANANAAAATPSLHANAEHPGVVQWRRARAGQVSLDADHFVVQPPAAAQWVLNSAP